MVASVNNQVAVLNRITAAFLKRHIGIANLCVSQSLVEGIDTIVVSVSATEDTMRKLTAHIASMYDVVQVAYYRPDDLVRKEYALYKISADRGGALLCRLSHKRRGRVVERTDQYIVLEKSGSGEQLESLRQTFETQNVLEGYSRSGNVVLHKDQLDNFYENSTVSLV